MSYEKVKAEGGPYDSLIQSASATHGVPYELLHKQLFLESSFNPKAKSPTGPRGLGQFTKQTGLAYGLVTDEDFYDPAKSVDAAARHMRDNIKLAGGDQLKALLLYNQGAGRIGRKQVEAYDSGDFNGVSPEGIKYMEKLMDVTNSGRRAELDGFLKSASVSGVGADPSYQAPASLTPQATVQYAPEQEEFPEMGLAGVDVPDKSVPFAQLLWQTKGNTEDDEGGLFDKTGLAAKESLQNSVVGMMIRAASSDESADFTQSFTMVKDIFNEPLAGGRLSDWGDEDYDKLRNSGLDPNFYDVVLRGYKRNFDANLALALENQKLVQQASGAGLGAQIAGGAAGALGDPWSLVAPGRGAAGNLGARLMGGAVAGGAVGGLSEQSAAKASGKEENLAAAIAGGAALGGTLNGIFGARPGGNSWDTPGNTPEGLSGDLLGPEGNSPAGAGLGNEQLRIESSIDGEATRVQGIDFETNRLANAEESLSGQAARLERREQARLEGSEEDPTRMPYDGEEPINKGPSGDYMDVPFDAEAARTMDGSIHSGGSPINPKTVDSFIEQDPFGTRAQRGFAMGSLSEIGYKLGRSENADVRGVAYDLFRSPTGYETGSNGKFGATAADIGERLKAQDNIAHNRFADQFTDILKDPFWRAQQLSEGSKREAISRRVVEALEDKTGTSRPLTPIEKELVESLREHMGRKWDYIENPAQFGDIRAKSLLEETRHEGSYFPQRYSTAAKHEAIERLGGREGLQEAIMRSWLSSYAKRPEVRARIDKMLQARAGEVKLSPEQLQEAVMKYAKDKAYGVSHTEQFNQSSLVDENLTGGVGIENNSYLEARNLFDSDVQVTLPDGSLFAVNDLREFDILRVVPQYDRRVNGDVAIMGGTGKTTKELKDLATKLRQGATPGKDMDEADALLDALKLFTGRARRDPDGAFSAAIRTLNDVGFMTKNAYMGVQNLTEAASLIAKGHVKMLAKGVPLLKRWTTAGTKLDLNDIKQMHDVVFGKELDDLIRPTRADIVESIRQAGSGNVAAQVTGSAKFVTGEASVRSPFTWLLRESGNYLMDSGRQGMLMDLVNSTLDGKKTSLFTPERLRSASITPEQFKGIEDLIKSSFKREADGKWRMVDAEKLAADPRAMHLWRLGDRIADETILRPHKMSNAASKQYGAAAAMALQFKMFVLRSLNGRLVRGWMESTRNGQALDQVFTAVLSVGLATSFYAASAHLKALGMPERARQKYLDTALSPGAIAYAAMSRSSHVGAPLGVANFVAAPLGSDVAAAVRTSILPREKADAQEGRPIKYNPLQSDDVTGFASRVLEQIPAAGVVAAGYQGIYSANNLIQGERGVDAQGHRTGLFNALRQFVPNDPLTQNLMMRLAQDQGVDRTR